MLDINRTELDVFHVVSEPGDATRYDYYIWFNYDEVNFISNKNNFKYPNKISKWSLIKEWEWDVIVDQSMKDNCNPHTMKECFRTASILIKTQGIK